MVNVAEVLVDGSRGEGIETVQRLWEVDLLRGVAIIMMVVYHLLYDLYYFAHYSIRVTSGFWHLFQVATATLFLLLVGVSLVLSVTRMRSRQTAPIPLYPRYLRRGLHVFALGMVLTLVTWIAVPQGVIIFGILHLIGVSIILAYPFYPLQPRWNLVIGVGIIAAGLLLQGETFDFPWLVWLGFFPKRFFAFDHFPLLPWFGVVQLGMFLGKVLYDGGVRRWPLPDLSRRLPIRTLCTMGRHALVIYVLHQPILFALLLLLGVISLNTLLAS